MKEKRLKRNEHYNERKCLKLKSRRLGMRERRKNK